MKKLFLIIMLLSTPSFTSAQINVSRISLDYGFVSNYQPSFDNDKLLTLSPEIKVGGKFIKNYFEWDFNLSYWDDGINETFHIIDAATYSYSSINMGIRLNYFPEKIYLPIHFISGLSMRFVNEKYIGGVGLSGNYRNDNSFVIYTLDFGAGLDFKVHKKVRVRLDALVFMPFNKKETLREDGWGGSVKIGIDYFINN